MEKIYLTNKLSGYFLYNYQNKSLLIKKTNPEEFIQIPRNIQVQSDQTSIKFFSKSKFKNELVKFTSILNLFLIKEKQEAFVKRIRIKGLGYKILREENDLILNLGYSKPIKTGIPTQISNIIIKKSIVVLESLDKVFLGNFASLLFSLKKRDIYKGKGLSLEYSSSKLKVIKKKIMTDFEKIIDLEFNTVLETLIDHEFLTVKKDEKNTVIIDPFELIKTINQLGLIIKDLKESKKDISVNLLVSSRFIKTVLQQFVSKLNPTSQVKISHDISEIKAEQIVIFCGDFSGQELNYFIKKLFFKGKYIFNMVTLDEKMYSNKNNSYTIYNESKEIRKLFYLAALIDKLITNN